MKKLVLSLLGAATLAISSNAMALNTNATFLATVTRGVVPDPVGTLYFAFNADESIHGCGYVAEWDSAALLPFSGQCWVVEAKTLGNFSCPDNAERPVASFVTIDTSVFAAPAPGPSPATTPFCTGFDIFQQFRQVWMLMLAEDPMIGSMEGIVEYTAASPIVYGIELMPH